MTGTRRLIVWSGCDNKAAHSSPIQPRRAESFARPLFPPSRSEFLLVIWRRLSLALVLMAGLMPAAFANAAPDRTPLAQAQPAPPPAPQTPTAPATPAPDPAAPAADAQPPEEPI